MPGTLSQLAKHVPRSVDDNVFKAISLCGLIVCLIILAVYWPQLPENVPQHIGVTGAVDTWGDKSLMIIFFGAIPVVFYLLIEILNGYIKRYNDLIGSSAVLKKHTYETARKWMLWLRLELIWMFAYVEGFFVIMALGTFASDTVPLMPLILAVVVMTTLYYFGCMFIFTGRMDE